MKRFFTHLFLFLLFFYSRWFHLLWLAAEMRLWWVERRSACANTHGVLLKVSKNKKQKNKNPKKRYWTNFLQLKMRSIPTLSASARCCCGKKPSFLWRRAFYGPVSLFPHNSFFFLLRCCFSLFFPFSLFPPFLTFLFFLNLFITTRTAHTWAAWCAARTSSCTSATAKPSCSRWAISMLIQAPSPSGDNWFVLCCCWCCCWCCCCCYCFAKCDYNCALFHRQLLSTPLFFNLLVGGVSFSFLFAL